MPLSSPPSFSAEENEQQTFTHVEEETEEEHEILDRWHWRNPTELDLDLFDPVWTDEEGYPGEMLEELGEMVGDGRGKHSIPFIPSFIGLRLMHLKSPPNGRIQSDYLLDLWLDDVVQAIGDSVCMFEDELVSIPIGTHPALFLHTRYSEERRLPAAIGMEYLDSDPWGFCAPQSQSWSVSAVPSIIPSETVYLDISSVYPWHRRQCFPASVRMARVKNHKSMKEFRNNAKTISPIAFFLRARFIFRDCHYLVLNF